LHFMMRIRITNSKVYSSIWIFLFPVLLISWISCNSNKNISGEEETYQIDREYRRGPVTFRVAVSKEEITIAEHIRLLLEARVEEEYQVRLPSFGDKLEQFGIVDYTTPSPTIEEEGMVVTRRIYELEPFLSGEYRIPPMKVEFWQEGDTLIHQVESDTLKIDVTSILPADMEGKNLKDIAPPGEIPADHSVALIIILILVLVAVIGFIIWWKRRKVWEEKVPKLLAHQIAFARLERLLARELVEKKKYREFTAEVADILRYYIEDRFGIHAPEQTTEEFLSDAANQLDVDPGQKEILGEFLVHSDLVKFAALQPSEGEVKKSFETCRDFIDTTKVKKEVKEQAA
jgi:hypothetical protein